MKSTRMTLAFAAAMALGGTSVATLFAEDTAPRDTDQTTLRQDARQDQNARQDARSENLPALRLPTGTKAIEDIKIGDMRQTIAEVTEAAMTKGGFDDMVERFVDQDRNRLGQTKLSDDEQKTLDGRIAQLQKAFQSRYNHEFDIDDVNKVLSNTTAIEGEITDAKALAAAWPVPVNPGSPEARTAASRTPAHPDVREDQANIKNGREIGIVRYASRTDLPTLDISMIDEAGGWKIDLPNTRTTPEVYKDLMTQLTYLGEHTDQWPTDINDAYRLFAHHVLMAIQGVETPAHQG